MDHEAVKFLGRADARQVYARDVARSGEAPLLFLPDGGADDVRARTRAGQLVCPVPECPAPLFDVRGGTRRHHFAHRRGTGVEHAPERVFHVEAKAMLAAWASERHPQLTAREEAWVPEIGRRPDVLVTSPTGRRMALEIQYAGITVEEWRRRHDDYARAGIIDVWLWGHIPPHGRPPRGRHADAEVALTPTMRACRDTIGRPLLWANPRERLIAVGGCRLDFPRMWSAHVNLDDLSVAFEDDRAAVLRAGPLTSWSLRSDGLTSPDLEDILRCRALLADIENCKAERAAEIQREIQESIARVTSPDAAPTDEEPDARQAARKRRAGVRAAPAVSAEERRRAQLRRWIADEAVCDALERSLPSDVTCREPPEVWHLMVALHAKTKDAKAILYALRDGRCGGELTLDAVVGVLQAAANVSARPYYRRALGV